MATTTILRNIGGVDDVKAVLSNSTLRRLLSIGTSWNKIRIGLRLAFQDYSAFLGSTPRLVVGVCAGTANPYNSGSAPTDHWVGSITLAANWSYSAGPPKFVTHEAATMYTATRVGTTLTLGSANMNPAFRIYLDPTVRTLFFLDITKGSPTFNLNCFVCTTSGDVSQATFLEQVTLASPSAAGHQIGSERAVAVNEASNGFLNAVNVSWDRSLPKLEISDLAIVRFL